MTDAPDEIETVDAASEAADLGPELETVTAAGPVADEATADEFDDPGL